MISELCLGTLWWSSEWNLWKMQTITSFAVIFWGPTRCFPPYCLSTTVHWGVVSADVGSLPQHVCCPVSHPHFSTGFSIVHCMRMKSGGSILESHMFWFNQNTRGCTPAVLSESSPTSPAHLFAGQSWHFPLWRLAGRAYSSTPEPSPLHQHSKPQKHLFSSAGGILKKKKSSSE